MARHALGIAASVCGGAALLLAAGIGGARAEDRPLCGLGNGQAATGEPILIGAVVGETGPDDFSAGADAARAYFNCVNENGGINGRPIEYLVEDDQWNPEVASQVATKLVKDEGVVALVGNGSFVEMTVNAKLYADEDVAVVASACAVRECFEASHIASTNQGPVPSNILSTQWAIDNLGTEKVACIALNIPSNGVWSCDMTDRWLEEQGKEGVPVLFDPGSADLTAVVLEAVATGADTMLVSLPANLGAAVLKVAEEQSLRDNFHWIAPTPLYKKGLPEALGDYWSGKVYINVELTPWDWDGPDAKRWLEVMNKSGRAEDPRNTFSQAGFVSANILVAADGETGAFDRACAVFPELQGFADRPADTLSGGQQQMVALGQALVADPAFILADEMSLGLAPVIVRRLMGVVEETAKRGIGVLLIEQFTHLALEIADHAYVLNRGRIRFDGSPAELKANPRLLEEAYLAASA